MGSARRLMTRTRTAPSRERCRSVVQDFSVTGIEQLSCRTALLGDFHLSTARRRRGMAKSTNAAGLLSTYNACSFPFPFSSSPCLSR